jgi:putative chitinase
MDYSVLKNIIPDSIILQLPDLSDKFAINTELRLAHFLSQCAHESNNFSVVKENLNYSESALLSLFSKYFNEKTANIFARQPEKIANIIYANRMGNGNETSGDGWKHRGFGYIQLTGKTNQDAFADFIGDPKIKDDPELIATNYPLTSAVYFFISRNILPVCDQGSNNIVIAKITRLINGGLIGLSDRTERFNRIYKLLS